MGSLGNNSHDGYQYKSENHIQSISQKAKYNCIKKQTQIGRCRSAHSPMSKNGVEEFENELDEFVHNFTSIFSLYRRYQTELMKQLV